MPAFACHDPSRLYEPGIIGQGYCRNGYAPPLAGPIPFGLGRVAVQVGLESSVGGVLVALRHEMPELSLHQMSEETTGIRGSHRYGVFRSGHELQPLGL